MATYSLQELESYALGAGFSPSDAQKMAAIAYAESSGDSNVIGHYGGVNYFGLWQISGVHSGEFNMSNWSDPAANASMAYWIAKNRGGITRANWQTYGGAKYLAALAKLKVSGINVSVPYPGYPGIKSYLPTPSVKSGGAIPGTAVTSWEWNEADHMYKYYTPWGWSESPVTPDALQAAKGNDTKAAKNLGYQPTNTDAGAAVGGPFSTAQDKAIASATSWAGGLTTFLSNIVNPLMWERILYIVGGFIIIVVAAFIMFSKSKTGAQVEGMIP